MPPSDDSEDGSSVTYTSIRRANDTVMHQRRYTSPDTLQPPQRLRRGVSPLVTHKSEPDYDNLKPGTSAAAHRPKKLQGSYIRVDFSPSPTPAEPGLRTSPDGEDGTAIEDHDYEELPAVQDDDFDSYVYMAPSINTRGRSFGLNSGKK